MARLGHALSRRLYLRIWAAVVGAVLVLAVLAGWAWHVMERAQTGEPTPRELVVRNAQGEVVGMGTLVRERAPGQPPSLTFTLPDGQRLSAQLLPRPMGGAERRGPKHHLAPPWLRGPSGFLWLLGIVAVAVAVGVFPFVRRLTARLEALQGSVQRWGEGDLSVRASTAGHDEVADLAQRFNAAAERIESLVMAQKSLLANASHELRSPLARIRMAMELMGQAGSSGARAEIARNIGELDQLIDEILLASRLDAREADMGTVESVDLVGLLAEECSRVDATLNLESEVEALQVRGVTRLLRRLVRNLLENARRHGRGEVQAGLAREGAAVRLSVRDNGAGVPEALRERIFEPFFRAPGASEASGGVGLGLALVKSIAERHGGQARCEAAPDGGAVFVVSFPALPMA